MNETIKKFLRDEILSGEVDGELTEDSDLLLSGMIDSIGLIRLIAFLEEQYGVQVPPEEVTIDRFRSISAMVRYLTELRGND
jgi:D-alanine--poly(phosphoribitol) ligase subunit 2